MRVGIMQPYFFPYLGYYSLIKHTDAFVLFDSVQFIRHGWIERNRVLKQSEGWLYIQIPLLKHNQSTLIKDIRIDDNQNWKLKILSQIHPYKKIAPNYFKVKNLIDELFSENFNTIVSLNKHSLELICQYLGFKKELPIFSQMNLEIEPPRAPDEWALNICKAMTDVSEYWNPLGGGSFFDKDKYDLANIDLKFHKINLLQYDQKRDQFESGLSIIDVLMFNSIEEINIMLDNYELI
ncbi:MAG: WbqC family protein [Paludibacter sp.]|nr:WbqC family protein [Paludibacter sp.]